MGVYMRKTFKIKLKYINKVYVIFDEWRHNRGWLDVEEGARRVWTYLGLSGDKARSRAIRDFCDPSFPLMEEGSSIKLISFEVL